MQNEFERLAEVVKRETTDIATILAAVSLVRDYNAPLSKWPSPDDRFAELQSKVGALWDNAERIGLTRNYRFNAAWEAALRFALHEGVLAAAAD